MGPISRQSLFPSCFAVWGFRSAASRYVASCANHASASRILASVYGQEKIRVVFFCGNASAIMWPAIDRLPSALLRFLSLHNNPQTYLMIRGIVMVVVGILIGVMSVIGCVGTHRQIQRDRESSWSTNTEKDQEPRAVSSKMLYRARSKKASLPQGKSRRHDERLRLCH